MGLCLLYSTCSGVMPSHECHMLTACFVLINRQILVDLGQDTDVDVKYWAEKYT